MPELTERGSDPITPDDPWIDRLLCSIGLVRMSRHRQLWRAYSDVFGWWSAKVRADMIPADEDGYTPERAQRLLDAVMDPDKFLAEREAEERATAIVEEVRDDLEATRYPRFLKRERPGQPSTEPPPPPSGPASASPPPSGYDTPGCVICGRDNDHGAHDTLELTGHLDHTYRPRTPEERP